MGKSKKSLPLKRITDYCKPPETPDENCVLDSHHSNSFQEPSVLAQALLWSPHPIWLSLNQAGTTNLLEELDGILLSAVGDRVKHVDRVDTLLGRDGNDPAILVHFGTNNNIKKTECTKKGFYGARKQTQGEAARAASRNGRIYVGNLPADVREKELEELFHRYGRIRSVELKNRSRCSSSPFAFIKFQDPRDAEDAVFGRNGYDFGSCRLRVEFPRPFRGSWGDGGGYGAPRGRNGPPSRRSDFRVLVSGLPPSGSWQDLKDHMRKAGDVCYADVHKDGMGIVEFIRKEDMEYALRKLDDTKFRSHEGENYYIRVCPERNASYSRSRSRSRGRDSPYQSRRSPSPFRPY
ncbi:serine/arginine-rich splicing factor 9-like [Discoglossus pictus]